ncbi:hypothetical protein CWR45_07510 [Oceanobacillus chungangensis]|uniref:Cell wall-active antibiotics response LiaF-like C-terminal domain-containing protein n=1 Tax=Oceanobacillus chungangensis TaxID=1229152 RepID=A0A3D8PX61_9BACI|nr:hypothetical protein CWR45_07510 [Oceanobacillus chungangensis]
MKHAFRYFIAIVLIIFGLMLVLANIGMINFEIGIAWQYMYPTFFVFIGIKCLGDYFLKRGGSWSAGSFLLIFGTLLLLDRFEVISFDFWDVFKLWPLLIVYIGFMMFERGSNIVFEYESDTKNKKKKAYHGSTFSIGNHEFNEQNWKVEPMNLKNLAGEFYFDFSKAFIPEKKIPFAIHSLAGDVNIIIPENVAFRVDASVSAGEIVVIKQSVDGINRSLKYETENYEDAVQKLDFNIRLRAGSIRIYQV